MKTQNSILASFLIVFISCTPGTKPNVQKVSFGIYEGVPIRELPGFITDTLKAMKVQFETDIQKPIIGFISKADSLALQLDLSKENFRLVRTHRPVDLARKHFAIVAIRPRPVIGNAHISNTVSSVNNVEIHFTMEGARKWAELTRNNIGDLLIFTVNNQVYTMPMVNAEIKSGVAVMNNLDNAAFAKNLSEALNASSKK